jgi:predicted nucleic acid-binding protein
MSEITEAEPRDLIDLHLGIPLTVNPTIPLLKAAYNMAVGPGHLTAYDCSYPVLARTLGAGR